MEVQKQEPPKEKKKSKFMKYFGRSLLTGVGFYAIFYASMYDVMMYKHKIRTEEEIQEIKNGDNLLVEDYIATIDNKRKCVTFFGEMHVYNLKEHLRSIDLVEKYDKIYFETGSRKYMQANVKKENELLAYTIDYFAPVYRYYLGLWSERYYLNISDYLEEKNKPCMPLEDLNYYYEKASALYLFKHFYENFNLVLFGPWNYKSFKYNFTIKEILDYVPSHEDRENLLDGRDIIMAKNIAKAIRESEVPILAGFGLLHYNGIMKNLRERENVLLEKVDSLEECKRRLESCEYYPYYKFY